MWLLLRLNQSEDRGWGTDASEAHVQHVLERTQHPIDGCFVSSPVLFKQQLPAQAVLCLQTRAVLKLLYDEDVVEEAFMQAWFAKPSAAKVLEVSSVPRLLTLACCMQHVPAW